MRVLIVEDDQRLAELIRRSLASEFIFDWAGTEEEAKAWIDTYPYHGVILDRNLHGNDVGLTLIEQIKRRNPDTGVIVVSAYGTTEDKIDGLTGGADDYLEKPFDMMELKARLHALIRRFHRPTVALDGMQMDLTAKTVTSEGSEIKLSRRERDILFFLLANIGKVVSREDILNSVYANPQDIASNTIDVTINNIRKKLPANIIQTIKTRGYMIVKSDT